MQSLTNFSDGSDAAKSKDLVLNENLLLRRETHFYFGDAYGHFARANKKKLIQLFPNDEQNIENYLKEHKVNFDKREDVEKLAEFLNNLY